MKRRVERCNCVGRLPPKARSVFSLAGVNRIPAVFTVFLAFVLILVSDVTNTQASYNADDPLAVAITSVASGKSYAVGSGLARGDAVYIDRKYTYTALPPVIQGALYIQTANDDKYARQENLLTFSANQDVTVYVGYDDRARSLPHWLSGWNAIGEMLGTTDVRRDLFSKDFPQGSITLGGNRASGAAGADSNYTVMVVRQGYTPPAPNRPPEVNAGLDATVFQNETASLSGAVRDEGLPSGQLATQWSKVKGPGSVTFADAGSVNTTATFEGPGVYLLSLTADDGALSATDEVIITVIPTTPGPLEVTIVKVVSERPYVVVPGGLASGADVYIDRTYTFTSVTSTVQDAMYIKTANNDKNLSGEDFLTLSVNQDVTVYIAYDERAKSLPNWLAGWTPVGEMVDTTDVGRDLFSLDFPAGSIVLGGNKASGASGVDSTYNVIVVGHGPSTPSANQAPRVEAGQNQTVTMSSPAVAFLDGMVSDDGLPEGQLSLRWSKVSGPGPVTFADPQAEDTTATFVEPGRYILRLTADDGAMTSSDDLAITVVRDNQPPVVDAGPSLAVILTDAAILDGTVTDDGLPDPPGEVTVRWTKASGPGPVVFADEEAVDTTATFSQPGTYVLRIAASDSALVSSDEVKVTVIDEEESRPLEVSVLSVASGQAYPVVPDGLAAGASVYTDRAYTFTAVPGSVESHTYIKTANDDKNRDENSFLTFSVNQDVTVYVAYDERAGSVPDWLSGWAVTGEMVGTTDVARRLFSRDFPAGNITLGGNMAAGASGAGSNYNVIIKGKGHAAPPPAQNQAPRVNAGQDITVDISGSASLNGTVSDDGLPNPPGSVTATWVKISGPGSVTFGNPAAVATTATFAQAGTYVLRLTADDGALTASDDVVVTVVSSSPVGTIALDPGVRYQTIVGWEATAGIGHWDYPNDLHRWRDEVAQRAVNELGLNRLRVETHQGRDRVEATNDNSDPEVINWDGFDFSKFDEKIDDIVLPMKQQLAARGERLYLNLCTVEVGADGNTFHQDPEEFAEFVLAHFLHLESKYGFVPDAVEVSLEPEVFDTFDQDPRKYGAALVATGDRLAAHGYRPDFMGPSSSTTLNALRWFDGLVQVPRVLDYLTEFSYHRYSVSADQLEGIADRARQHNLGTSMLEHIGADYHELHQDLTVANIVAWQQFTLAYPGNDNGGAYFKVTDVSTGDVNIGSRSKFLSQYFKFIRKGAVRINASSSDGKFDPVAFINANGKYVVVVKAGSAGNFSVSGLPAGTYGVTYTTGSQYDVGREDITIGNGQLLTTSIPAQGVITIYKK